MEQLELQAIIEWEIKKGLDIKWYQDTCIHYNKIYDYCPFSDWYDDCKCCDEYMNKIPIIKK